MRLGLIWKSTKFRATTRFRSFPFSASCPRNYARMGLCAATVVRSLAIVGFAYSWYCHINLYFPDEFGGTFRLRYGSYYGFLTVLNFLFSIFVNFLLLLGDFFPTVQHFGQALNFSMSFPATMLVSIPFWAGYAINPELVSGWHPKFYPFWLNLVEHALILPVALFNITRGPFDMSRKVSYGLAVISTFAYFSWVLHIFNESGIWVYNFLEVIGKDKFIYVSFPSTFVVVPLFQFIGWKINAFCCPKQSKTKKNWTLYNCNIVIYPTVFVYNYYLCIPEF